jgi:DnaA family protein
MSQLALPLQLADHAVFASYLATGNEALVAELQALVGGDAAGGCYLWGAAATGKTHLLQAVCDQAGDESIYLPMDMVASASPAMLDGLADRHLICIDDLDAVIGKPDWERALFVLYNQVIEVGSCLIVAASASPRRAIFALADLQSRLSQLPVFQLQELNDADTCKALQLRARHRGLDLPDDTAQFLLSRHRRDMASLYRLLDRLDSAAMQAQRRLTIPFVRQVLLEEKTGTN